MSTAPGNIFLTTENLAFSLPLIAVCGTYAYFKYIPLNIGLPVLGGLFLLYQISVQVKNQRNKRLQNMDDRAINDLALQLEDEEPSETDDAAAKKLAKKKAAIQRRLAAEAKKESKQKGRKKKKQDDDDDVDLDTFVKAGKKKN
mmetsp:Transcript_99015/g.285726  ORF Transcript_99015/g.285726 Transcript_99015/m.285726 type:complete len:144 (-) Transcript_99015:190-621(-)